jgi:hypothetical protein
VIIKGSRSTSARSISNDALPEPITIDERNSIVGTLYPRRMPPTSCREARCWERSPSPSPPR